MKGIVAGALIGAALWGCGDDCPREGCDAMTVEAEGSGTGIGGWTAYLQDVVEDGCQACGFDSTTLSVFGVPAPITSDQEATEVVRNGDRVLLMDVVARYNQLLEAGQYLVCSASSCVNIQVAEGRTSTLNVKLRNGRTSFYVLDPSHDALEEDFGFDVTGVMRRD